MTPTVHQLDVSELQDVLYYAPFGVLVEDCEGYVMWMNHTLQWQLGVDERDVLGTLAKDLPMEPIAGARGKRVFRVPRFDGWGGTTQLKCIEDILPEYSESGIRVRYFLESSEPASAPALKNDLLRLLIHRPVVDRVTGMQDKDAIVSTLRAEVSRSRRYGNPLSIIVLGIHALQAGGTVVDHPSRTMSAASALLRDSTRWADSVGRYGEREFLLVLPETTATAAAQLARKIDGRIDEHNAAGQACCFSAHFGVVEWGKGDDESMLLRRGQQALEQAAAG